MTTAAAAAAVVAYLTYLRWLLITSASSTVMISGCRTGTSECRTHVLRSSAAATRRTQKNHIVSGCPAAVRTKRM